MKMYLLGNGGYDFRPAALAGFAPYLRTNPSEPEMVAIATRDGHVAAIVTWPLAVFSDAGGRDRFRAFWSGSDADALYLIAIDPDMHAGAEALNAAHAILLESRADLVDAHRCLVTGNGTWGLVQEFRDGRAPQWPVEYPEDDSAALVAAIAGRAALRSEEWGKRLTHTEPGQRRWVRERIAHVRRMRLQLTGADRTKADVALTLASLDDDDTLGDWTVDLGIAVCDNPVLRSWLVQRILHAPNGNGRLWADIAANFEGPDHAVICALAALAAWTEGEDYAVVAVTAALESDPDCALAVAVFELIDSGVTPESLDVLLPRTVPEPGSLGAPSSGRQRA